MTSRQSFLGLEVELNYFQAKLISYEPKIPRCVVGLTFHSTVIMY